MTPAVVVGFVFALIVAAVAFVCWWSADSDLRDHTDHLRDHTERLAVLEAALNLGGEPQVLIDPPTEPIGIPTEPMPAVDVAGGLRTRVAAAREANRPKPTPFPRKGRHSA